MVVLGQRGKISKIIGERTGANLSYIAEDHRIDFFGRPKAVEAAAELVERAVQHYQYSGLQFARKENLNLLCPELTDAPGVQLLRSSRPINTVSGGVEGFVLAPLDEETAAETGLFSDRSQQPGASTSGQQGNAPAPPRLLRPAADAEACLQRVLDLAVTISLQHPAQCERTELRLYLGKLALVDVATSARLLPPGQLLEWAYPKGGRAVFETALPQATVVSLDKYLTSRGMVATQQAKSASLHLETSIPWVQYHPTFSVDAASGQLRLAKLETLGCKPLTVALVGPPDRTDVRLRYVASVEHSEDDPVASELRRREGEFTLSPNGVQINIPDDLHTMDLTLTSARVKLKRVYVSSDPLQPPPSAWPLPPAASAASAPAAPAAGTTRRRRRSAAAPAAAPLPPVRLKVSVAAVLDNFGARRLEVTVACPEVNAALMELHRTREEGEGARARLEALVRSLLAHVQHLRENVAFEP
ncbi:hypothetical protein GPECTOR_14g20 [Gonium pectorale]|uniref:K Homology domain-containing protein n=1 Tax=Gonium pectorale TaxID=33097 RepID=A0A150GMG4_GONPE|nr:hypothetical protein GPECTOR_14g20 [Gonium pectorale]|eukprot:KXZ50955.1 hypothetical protein GPECTOR_14g20 [Gonium pectorale]